MAVVTGIMVVTVAAEYTAMKGWTYAHGAYLLTVLAETREEAFLCFQEERTRINAAGKRNYGDDFMFHPSSMGQLKESEVKELRPGAVTSVYRPRN